MVNCMLRQFLIVLMLQFFWTCNGYKYESRACKKTMINACKSHPGFRGAVCHSDRAMQYTSQTYRDTIKKYKMQQSMNSAGGRCHDNARCESMWARLKDELFYSRNLRSTDYTVEELKVII